ncbi:hypothetical protein KA005_72630, partial [bacterium]|nr:hypothetical protein [bacterium]
SWGQGQSVSPETRTTELELEKIVSKYIGKMSILWLDISDAAGPSSDRAFIEKNSIALLSGPKGPIDIPSDGWLGNFSSNNAIRNSGLWNVNYVDYNYDDRFLEIFTKYVDAVGGRCPVPDNSIAPEDWYTADKRKDSRGQTFLFRDL